MTLSRGAPVPWSSGLVLLRPTVIAGFLKRDLAIMTSYRVPLVMDAFFGLMNLLIFYYISRALGASSENLDGAPNYFAFVATGLSISLVIQAAATGVARRVREEQLTGTMEVLVAQPVSPSELSVGLAGFQFAFAITRASVYLLLAALLLGLDLSRANVVGYISMMVVSAAALLGLGILVGALTIVFKRAEALTAVLMLGLGLLGGALFPIEVLPAWVGPLTYLAPTRYVFHGVRQTLFGGDGWVADLLVLCGIAAVLLPASIIAFAMAIRRAQRAGSISQY